ncbi:hypothetical protein C8F01DRAFT_1256546 [Mycena amicta]|nr:hypothetical protein C8F01DRAFT_1256546 [Mycena amicta]
MPSAFDILGVLSFVQGVITVLAAGLLSFRVSTEQLRENMRSLRNVKERLIRMRFGRDPMFTTPLELGLVSEAIERRPLENISKPMTVNDAITQIDRRSLYERWWDGDEESKTIMEITARLGELRAEATEVRIGVTRFLTR